MTNDTWGLNFTSPIDAKQFRECCVSIISYLLHVYVSFTFLSNGKFMGKVRPLYWVGRHSTGRFYCLYPCEKGVRNANRAESLGCKLKNWGIRCSWRKTSHCIRLVKIQEDQAIVIYKFLQTRQDKEYLVFRFLNYQYFQSLSCISDHVGFT